MSKKLVFNLDPIPSRAIVLDTETTGFTPKQGHRIVELAAIELIGGTPSGKVFHAYINPCQQVPAEASNVHGLTTAFLKDKPVFSRIAAQFSDFLGCPSTPIWAHNASFDRRFVEAEMTAAGQPFEHSFACSLKLARALEHGAPGGNKLESLAAHINYRWGARGAHSALEDTQALAAVLKDLLWPLEAAAARAPVPVSKPKASKPSPAAKAAIKLPRDFQALTSQSDDRIRRYDGLSLGERIFARGRKWTRQEEAALAHRFLSDDATIDVLVTEHGRTPAALILKLEGLGIIAPGHPYAR